MYLLFFITLVNNQNKFHKIMRYKPTKYRNTSHICAYDTLKNNIS